MAIAFRSVASTYSREGLSSPFNFSITKPSGMSNGDLMLACIMWQSRSAFDSNPAGWSTLGTKAGATGATGAGTKVLYRIVDGTEGGSFTWSMDETCDWAGAIIAYSGVDSASPIDVSASTGSLANTTQCIAPSVTPTVANAMLVTVHGCNPNTATTGVGSTHTFTTPAGMTERHDSAISPSTATTLNALISINELLLGAPAPTGTKTANVSNNGHTANWAVALAPATTTPPSTGSSTQMIAVRRLPRQAAQPVATIRSSFY